MKRKRKLNLGKLGIAFILLAFLASFYKLPYYVSTPGSAETLEQFVDVENGSEAKGAFMLTTIRMGRANIYTYAWAKIADYHKIYKLDEIRSQEETDEEYTIRQLKLMDDSQTSAILNGYKKAGYKAEVKAEGIYVLHIVKDKPADGILKPGDRIIKVDGKKIESSDFFIEYITSKKAGDQVKLQIKRDEKVMDKDLQVELLEETGKVGVGITLVEDRSVETNRDIEINSDNIGGPSAGLMFTLEIFNQLTEEDYTKGKKIAGTGTISDDGTVGPIGGVDQKIVAADKAGAEVFFAPNQQGAEDSDYQLAVKTAEEIDTDMVIVPVDTVDDALNYLKSMK